MVPGGGVEPPRPCDRRILSPLRLPVPPSRQRLAVSKSIAQASSSPPKVSLSVEIDVYAFANVPLRPRSSLPPSKSTRWFTALRPRGWEPFWLRYLIQEYSFLRRASQSEARSPTATHHVVRKGIRLYFSKVFVFDTADGLITRKQAYEPYGPHGFMGALLLV